MNGTKALALFFAVPLLFSTAVQSNSCGGERRADNTTTRNAGLRSNGNAATQSNVNAGVQVNGNGNTTVQVNGNGNLRATDDAVASNRNAAAKPGGEMAHTSNEKRKRVPSGTWGGNHVRIEVRDGGADIEYDCAHGTIDAPLSLNDKGGFEVTGTHVMERGGPVRIDEKPDGRTARFAGRIDGQTMTLTVTLEGSSEELGTFTLKQGSMGRLWKCR